MRPSSLKHPLAVLRTTLELNQLEAADLLKRSPATIQSVEMGRLKLSEDFAERIADATGVDSSWLSQGDPTAPMIDQSGQPYTRETYLRRTQRKTKDTTEIEWRTFKMAMGAFTLCEKAHAKGHSYLAFAALSKALKNVQKELGITNDQLEEGWETRCREFTHRFRQVKAKRNQLKGTKRRAQ